MSLLEIKQQISRLSEQDREEVLAYLQRLRLTASSRGEAFARSISKMQAGNYTTAEALEARLDRE